MADQGGPIVRSESDRKLDRYVAAFESHGYTRWAVEGSIEGGAQEFLGYVGAMPVEADHPLGPRCEIGWRLRRKAWGRGFAVEAANAAVADAFGRCGTVGLLGMAVL